MKTNIWHNALKKGQVTVRAPLWASLVGAGVFVDLKMIQDITFGGGGKSIPDISTNDMDGLFAAKTLSIWE